MSEVATRLTSDPSSPVFTISPGFSLVSTVTSFISFIYSKISFKGTSPSVFTDTRGKSLKTVFTVEVMLLMGLVTSCTAYFLPFLHWLPSTSHSVPFFVTSISQPRGQEIHVMVTLCLMSFHLLFQFYNNLARTFGYLVNINDYPFHFRRLHYPELLRNDLFPSSRNGKPCSGKSL